MKKGSDLEDTGHCSGARLKIGDWGGNDPELKLERCFTEVKADPNCGTSFYFRADKGRCFCQQTGFSCARESAPLIDEYRLNKGM